MSKMSDDRTHTPASTVLIISIDIGLRNMAVVSKRFTVSELNDILTKIKKVPADLRYNETTGEALPTFDTLLNNLYAIGTIEYFNKMCFVQKCQVNHRKEITDDLLLSITDYVLGVPHIKNVNTHIVIEHQLTKNAIAVRIQNHIHSTLLNALRSAHASGAEHQQQTENIHFAWSWLKTKVLGAPRKMSQNDRKRWSYKVASTKIYEYDRTAHSDMFVSYNHDRADLSDAYLQIHAWLVNTNIDIQA